MKQFYSFVFLSLLVFTNNVMGQGFQTSGNRLLDAHGQEFTIRGMNVPFAWYFNDSYQNLSNIKNKTSANTIRIVWDISKGLPDSYWQNAVTQCIKLKMVPLMELHDATGSNDPQRLLQMARWWASKAYFINRPEISKYLLVNIANEWGDWYMASPAHSPAQITWRDAYKDAIKIIRGANIKVTLVIDGSGYGQDIFSIKTWGQELINGDLQKNILFSVHMYCDWTNPSRINAELEDLKNRNLPLVIGEFAHSHPPCGTLPVKDLMKYCQQKKIGYLAWSWKGNGGNVTHLDMSYDWAGNNLTDYGNAVVYDANGIKNTSVTCSAFNPLPPVNSNLALKKYVKASSIESNFGNTPVKAVDGSGSTRWSSIYADNQWIQIDLAAVYAIQHVVLKWEAAYGSSYRIEVSENGTSWISIYQTNSGNGGIDDLKNLSGKGRYIRMYGIKRATQWGFSLYEMEVYGTKASYSGIFEAEYGTLSGVYKEINLQGFSGKGYVNGFDNPGDHVRINVSVPSAGNYTLAIRYAAPYGEKRNFVQINGQNRTEVDFPASSSWRDITLSAVYLNAGLNMIEISHSWGWFYVDRISLVVSSSLRMSQTLGNVNEPESGSNNFISYPNPAADKLTILLDNPAEAATVVSIVSMEGVVVHESIVYEDREINIDLSQINTGMYVVKFVSGGEVITKRLLIQK